MIKFLGYALDVGILLVILSLLLYLAFRIYDTSYFKGKRGEKKTAAISAENGSKRSDTEILPIPFIRP